MKNLEEFLDRNLEELKALQIDEVKVIDGVRLKGDNKVGCNGCCFIEADCHKIGIKKESIGISCILKEVLFGFVEVDENGITLEDED